MHDDLVERKFLRLQRPDDPPPRRPGAAHRDRPPHPHGTVIVHSDRGSQFRSRDFRAALKAAQLSGSMGRVAAAGDNRRQLNRQQTRGRWWVVPFAAGGGSCITATFAVAAACISSRQSKPSVSSWA